MKDRLFEIWFSLRCGVGNREFTQLLERFGTPYDLYKADENELEGLPCSRRLKTRLADKSLSEATRIMEYCRATGVGILFWQDEDYPASLRPLRDPPVLLYYRGRLPDLSRRLCISVVGTRSMSEYGKRIAYKIGYELGAAGAVVVSGMALGNDGVAATGAMLSGGTTVAILGSGIDVIYPPEHGRLFTEITAKGAVMSEFAPGTPPERKNFPIRNRIISGLSQGTVVVEGDPRSGALITARTAILQGRDIYAFPGNVGETNSAGSNKLISDGAVMILRARDLLENYAFLYGDALDMGKLTRAEARSDIDEAGLERLGVCVRTEKPKADAPSAQTTSADPSKDRRRKAPSDIRRGQGVSKSTGAKAPEASVPPKSVPARGDASDRALKSLTDTQRRIFEALPLDHAVAIDYFTREGYSVGEIMATMTVLEIKGLTVTLPGGLYSRK
ncbi:MAG: DNA-processing protein DprA [Clostridia bacterium]|nr:DNA-processing protein DprA [Clostridia bacterium]